MCLSTVFLAIGDEEETLCKNASRISFDENGDVTITDLLGNQHLTSGRIREINLIENRIVLEQS